MEIDSGTEDDQQSALVDKIRSMALVVSNEEANPPAKDSKSSTTLSNLPSELIVELLRACAPSTSTLLGLTSKTFYSIHRELYGSVPLISLLEQPPLRSLPREKFLYDILKNWMPPTLRYCIFVGKFVTIERDQDAYDDFFSRGPHRGLNPGLHGVVRKRNVELDWSYEPF